MSIAISITFLAALVFLFFVLTNRQAKRKHLAFRKKDVQAALENVLSDQVVLHDEWDMFLAWPIADPYLEGIRKRCMDICANDTGEPNRDLSEAGSKQVDAILQELRMASDDQSIPPT